MAKLVRKILKKEIWFLRIAVTFPLLWAGIGSILNPTNWIGFVPSFVESFIEPEIFLVAHGFVLIITSAGILAGFWRPFFAAVAAFNLLGILIFFGIDDITFRDVGLTIVAFLLFLKELKPRH